MTYAEEVAAYEYLKRQAKTWTICLIVPSFVLSLVLGVSTPSPAGLSIVLHAVTYSGAFVAGLSYHRYQACQNVLERLRRDGHL